MYYIPTRFLLHPISPNSIQITLAFPQQRTGNSPSIYRGGGLIIVGNLFKAYFSSFPRPKTDLETNRFEI
jgi:hypothetical protein